MFQVNWTNVLRASDYKETPWQPKQLSGARVFFREVSMGTPPPAAWAYFTGNTPVRSRREAKIRGAVEGAFYHVEEETFLDMPMGAKCIIFAASATHRK